MIGDLRLAKPSMQTRLKLAVLALLLSTLNSQLSTVLAFEGRIYAMSTQGSQTQALLYTVGTNFLRVENTATNWPNPVDILDRNSGELTLLFPNNRSFVHLKPVPENSSADAAGFSANARLAFHPALARSRHPPVCSPCRICPRHKASVPTNLPGMPAPPPMPTMPHLPPGVGPQSAPGSPAMPAMPPRPVMPNLPALPPGLGPQPVPCRRDAERCRRDARAPHADDADRP